MKKKTIKSYYYYGFSFVSQRTILNFLFLLDNRQHNVGQGKIHLISDYFYLDEIFDNAIIFSNRKIEHREFQS